jgi:TonB family protein
MGFLLTFISGSFMNIHTMFHLGLLAAAATLPVHCAAGDDKAAGASSSMPAIVDFQGCALPVWPKEALRKEQTGAVTLGFLIGSDGAVKDTRVHVSSGFPLLDEAAQSGIMRCTFKPATRNGEPLEAWMKMKYVWTLDKTAGATATTDAAMLAAANRGDAQAQLAMANRAMVGQGMPQSQQEAARWIRLAADQGNASAQNNLGSLLEKGTGVQQDLTEAALWYRKAADQGLPVAENNLGVLYFSGRGVTQDLAKAAEWYRKAA